MRTVPYTVRAVVLLAVALNTPVIWLLPKLLALTSLIARLVVALLVAAPAISKGDPGTVEVTDNTPEVLVTLMFLMAPEVTASWIAVCKAVAKAAAVAVPEAADVTLTPLMVTDAVSVVANVAPEKLICDD